MCTVEEFEEELEYNDDDLDAGEIISNNDKLEDEFECYSPFLFTYEHKYYIFVNWYDEIHGIS